VVSECKDDQELRVRFAAEEAEEGARVQERLAEEAARTKSK
jgi:hypothetical protein